ncbi:MAG: carbonate dehydratase [Burkholderiales bacterium]|nr:carbonate dehydratase [Burkholderiales bacterium]
MRTLQHLFENNRAWAAAMRERDARFFARLAEQQAPRYLWIGCSDSRVPANEIVGLAPGELFVHRNIANVVVHTDLNALSVLQFAVDLLGVREVIVCGHYGCSGVRNAMEYRRVGLADNWLRHVQDVHGAYAGQLAHLADPAVRLERMCELNVVEQVRNVCRTSVIEDAWARGQPVAVHGWIYGLSDGLLRDLDTTIESAAEIDARYQAAIAAARCRAGDEGALAAGTKP